MAAAAAAGRAADRAANATEGKQYEKSNEEDS